MASFLTEVDTTGTVCEKAISLMQQHTIINLFINKLANFDSLYFQRYNDVAKLP
jgi:hypothetical protein